MYTHIARQYFSYNKYQGVGVEGECAPSRADCEPDNNSHVKMSKKNLFQTVFCISQGELSVLCILYSGKFSREKTFTNFAVLEPPMKVFSIKFGRAIPTYMCLIGFSIPRKFIHEIIPLTDP